MTIWTATESNLTHEDFAVMELIEIEGGIYMSIPGEIVKARVVREHPEIPEVLWTAISYEPTIVTPPLTPEQLPVVQDLMRRARTFFRDGATPGQA